MKNWVAFVVNGNGLSKGDIIAIPEGLFIKTLINFEFEEDVATIAFLQRVGGDAVGIVQENVTGDELTQGK